MAKTKRSIEKSSDRAAAAQKGKAETETQKTDDALIVKGIWGLVYLAAGVLMLIAMAFYSSKQFPGSEDVHILGPWLGTRLALGLFYLFGRIPAFALSLAVCYIGAATFANKRLRLKLLLFIAALTIQLALLLAIRHIPELAKPVADGGGLINTVNATGSNFTGLLMINALSPVFGGRMFGPYFIVSLLMAITVMIGLRIKSQSIAALLVKGFVALVLWMKKAFAEVKTGIKNSPDILPEPANKDSGDGGLPPASVPANTRKKKTPAEAANTAGDNAPFDVDANSVNAKDNDAEAAPARPLTAEEEMDKALEEERAEWKKNAGIAGIDIQILAVETPDVELADDEALIPLVVDGDNREREDFIDDDDSEKLIDDDDGEGFAVLDLPKPAKPYELPSPDVIADPPPHPNMVDKETIERTAATLEKTLMHFKVEGKVVSVSPGPVVTRYEIVLAPGVKVSRVTSLQDDLLMAVSAEAIRIQAPIPGKSAVGIELPNETRQNVHFKHILLSSEFKKNFALPAIIGSNISGIPYVTDITKTPHLLVAGQTGSGKSVCMNSLICTMLMTKKPEELRLIMIDPKQVEFTAFENIPHLLAPVVTESKEAVKALQWGVIEMERRYRLLTTAGVRKVDDFNTKLESGKLGGVLPEEDHKQLPLIVIIIDELADLMMTAPKDVEGLIARITQKARAAGIHMIVATQRPSVNVITGLIKANLPSRIAFRTVSSVDSRTILDQGGSEKLLGMGDMLYLRNGAQNVERFHGAFIPDDDVEAIVAAIKEQGVELEKISSFHDVIEDPDDGGGGGDFDDGGGRDALFAEAARITVSIGQGSTSLLQRRMNIGFARAGRIMDQLERAGIVGPSKGSKTREVLVMPEELEGML
ncbi:MAG: DNA translocase FtsK [Chitinispirillales bacterium]|jgi:DNA segregation ATPase FtsK/SpoIIIE-like protein|nr:DNA translocase FtsK [Chitinispirillales bacterium]